MHGTVGLTDTIHSSPRYWTPRSDSKWPDEQTERLIALWNGGHSAGQCAKIMAEEFGVARSRMAIVGKIDRLRQHGVVLRASRASTNKPQVLRRRRPRPRRPAVAKPPPQRKQLPPEPPPPGGGIGILELNGRTCREPLWPSKGPTPGRDDQRYCGGQALPGRAWCRRHHARNTAGTASLETAYAGRGG